MKRYDGYDKAEAYTGEYKTLELGGHICVIKKVTSEEKDYGTLLRIGFDIAEGEHKGFYQRQFDRKKETNPDAKWQGMYYQTIKQDDLKYFKGFITAIENSNNGFKWDWDETKLKGKIFGGVFGEEEYQKNDGTIGKSVKCRFVRSAEQVRKGVEVPEIKKLKGNDAHSSYSSGHSYADNDDDELPF